MPKQPAAAQSLASIPHEDLCEYVADLSSQLADILRYKGFVTIVGLLDLASKEAERLTYVESVRKTA